MPEIYVDLLLGCRNISLDRTRLKYRGRNTGSFKCIARAPPAEKILDSSGHFVSVNIPDNRENRITGNVILGIEGQQVIASQLLDCLGKPDGRTVFRVAPEDYLIEYVRGLHSGHIQPALDLRHSSINVLANLVLGKLGILQQVCGYFEAKQQVLGKKARLNDCRLILAERLQLTANLFDRLGY